MSTPSPPSDPAGASTTTKILITIGAILAVVAGITWPTGTSPVIGQYAAVGAVLVTSISGVVHAVWDHTP